MEPIGAKVVSLGSLCIVTTWELSSSVVGQLLKKNLTSSNSMKMSLTTLKNMLDWHNDSLKIFNSLLYFNCYLNHFKLRN